MSKTISIKTKAWLGRDGGPENLTPERIVGAVTFYSPAGAGAYWKSLGYVFVGDAEITVTVIDEPSIVSNKIDALRATKTSVLAEAQAKATELESQIQKLLAISNEVKA